MFGWHRTALRWQRQLKVAEKAIDQLRREIHTQTVADDFDPYALRKIIDTYDHYREQERIYEG